jgi:hypothetical protein
MSVGVGGCRWVSVGVGGCRWVLVGVGGCRWVLVGVGGCLWKTVGDGGGEICKNTCLFSLGCTKKTKKKSSVDNVRHSGRKKATNSTLQGGDDSDDTVSLNSSSEFIKQDLSSDCSNDSDYCYFSDDGSDYEEYDDDDEDEYENEENEDENENLDDDLFDEEHQEQQPDGFGWKGTTAGHCS